MGDHEAHRDAIFKELGKKRKEREGFIKHLNLSFRNLNRQHLDYVAAAPQFRGVRTVDLSKTFVGWDELVVLWNSSMLGSLWMDEQQLYDRHYNLPVNTIEIEVGGCPIVGQYDEVAALGRARRMFPMPYRSGFVMSSPYDDEDDHHVGFKRFVVTVNGEDISEREGKEPEGEKEPKGEKEVEGEK